MPCSFNTSTVSLPSFQRFVQHFSSNIPSNIFWAKVNNTRYKIKIESQEKFDRPNSSSPISHSTAFKNSITAQEGSLKQGHKRSILSTYSRPSEMAVNLWFIDWQYTPFTVSENSSVSLFQMKSIPHSPPSKDGVCNKCLRVGLYY